MVSQEKSQIISNTEKNGTVILNKMTIFDFLNEKTKDLKVVCFGKHKSSDVRILNLQRSKNMNIAKIKVIDEIISLKFNI